jgi:hypothetical protein
MLVHRRCARSLALACTTAAVALAPAAAQARPLSDPPIDNGPPIEIAAAEASAQPIVREIRTEGDTTLALVLSGTALLIAAGAAAISGHDHRRIGRVV